MRGRVDTAAVIVIFLVLAQSTCQAAGPRTGERDHDSLVQFDITIDDPIGDSLMGGGGPVEEVSEDVPRNWSGDMYHPAVPASDSGMTSLASMDEVTDGMGDHHLLMDDPYQRGLDQLSSILLEIEQVTGQLGPPTEETVMGGEEEEEEAGDESSTWSTMPPLQRTRGHASSEPWQVQGVTRQANDAGSSQASQITFPGDWAQRRRELRQQLHSLYDQFQREALNLIVTIQGDEGEEDRSAFGQRALDDIAQLVWRLDESKAHYYL